MSGGVRSVSLALACSFLLCGHVAAQQTRVQLAGTNQFSTELHTMLGADAFLPVGGGPCVPGGPVCTPPSWQVVLAAYGGFVIDEIPLSLYGHLGLRYELSADLGLAVIGFGFMKPLQGGPALRFDAMDVAAFKGGYAWGDEEGVFAGLEVAGEFLLDLLFR